MNHELKKFPTEFLDRLKKIVPPGLMSDVARGFLDSKPITMRVNTLKASVAQVIKSLGKWGIELTPVDWLPNALIVKKGSFKKITDSEAYSDGWIYLQSLSSQIPPLVLAPKPGEHVLDMAAAPGGKTTQMAAMMNNEGRLVAIEPDRIRFERMEANIQRQGARVETFNRSALSLPEDFKEAFDAVLLDAPCSSEGTFDANDRSTFGHWSVDYVNKIAIKQKKLLNRAFECVKPGGRVVYSTCSLSPEENECVLDAVLSELKGIKAQPILLKSAFLKPPFSVWGKKLNPEVCQARRIYPGPTMEGFFVFLMTKN